MSEFTNRSVSRGNGVSLGGVAIAVVVLLAVIVVLSMLGSGSSTGPALTDDAAPASETAAPAVVPVQPAN